MIICRIEGFTRVLGKSQGYIGLPVKDIILRDPDNGKVMEAMETAWEPTPSELESLCKGQKVKIRLLCPHFIPIIVRVGESEPEQEFKLMPYEESKTFDSVAQMEVAMINTYCSLTPEQLSLIEKGENIRVIIPGSSHPPIMLEVAEQPETLEQGHQNA